MGTRGAPCHQRLHDPGELSALVGLAPCEELDAMDFAGALRAQRMAASLRRQAA
jgi:hypothetical protein